MSNTQMKQAEKQTIFKKIGLRIQQYNIREIVQRVKKLEGDPHFISMGMAIGVFVSITPTMPFHTVIAVALAFLLRGSKAAAAIGVWFCNPISAPFFYLGSYKLGIFIFGNSAPFDVKYESLLELLKLGMDVTIAMIAGGIILGILPGFASYFIMRKFITTIQSRKAARR
jgi:uncharacterized protein (DUF2062 family)